MSLLPGAPRRRSVHAIPCNDESNQTLETNNEINAHFGDSLKVVEEISPKIDEN